MTAEQEIEDQNQRYRDRSQEVVELMRLIIGKTITRVAITRDKRGDTVTAFFMGDGSSITFNGECDLYITWEDAAENFKDAYIERPEYNHLMCHRDDPEIIIP